jgi:hypothetical protein
MKKNILVSIDIALTCRFTSQLSLLNNLIYAANEGKLREKNGICHCSIGTDCTLFSLASHYTHYVAAVKELYIF